MEQHKCEKTKEIDRIAAENLAQQTQIEERVKWTMFWAILLVMFGLLGTIFNNIYSQMDEIHFSVSENTQNIDARLNEISIAQAKIDVQYVEIQKTLSEIKVQLTKIK